MKQILICCLATLMVGCGIYKPYTRPEVKSDLLYGAEFETSDSTSMADLRWEELFTDPQLQILIQKGLENNVDMQAAHLTVVQAEAALKSARLSYLPSFNLAPNGAVASFDNSPAAWTYTVPLAASWQVDIFGGLTNAKRRAKASYAQSQAYCQAVRAQLIGGIANCYYTLLMLDSQYRVTEEMASLMSKSAETMAAMMEAGMANRAGVSQMEAAAYAAHASLFDLCQQIREVENGLCALLGEVPHAIERSTLEEQILPVKLQTGLPVQLLSNRPDVQMAEYQLVVAHYATAGARSTLYPSLSLSGTAGWTNNAGSVIVNPGKLLLSAAAQLAAPLFNGGKARAQLKIAQAQQQEAALRFQQTLLDAGSEVNNALSAVQSARAKQEWRTRQVEALTRAYESTELLMKHGSTTYLEVLTAQQNLLSGRIAQIADRFEELQSTINLYTALGGGREIDITEE